MNQKIGIYMHVPFCKSKCHYCDFNSYSNKDEHIGKYFDALKRELILYSERIRGYDIPTIFIGGGTPSYVEPEYISQLLYLCKDRLMLSEDIEITLEANPGTLDEKKLRIYREAGINRLSIGLQAVQDCHLEKLGRIHSLEEFLENFSCARKNGFDNISIDLIFGLPEQSLSEWEETLSLVIDLKPEHISCYSLKIEDDTVFGKLLQSGELVPVSDELDRQMYYSAINRLKQAGFIHYEISNFAKPGFYSKHNSIYWKAEEYVGLGAGAHSYFKGERYNNHEDIIGYINSVNKPQNLDGLSKTLINETESMSEFVILGLRFIEGINSDEFKNRYGRSLYDVFGEQINNLISRRLLECVNNNIRLTSLGLDLANQVMLEFI